jgi:hypothetical protein
VSFWKDVAALRTELRKVAQTGGTFAEAVAETQKKKGDCSSPKSAPPASSINDLLDNLPARMSTAELQEMLTKNPQLKIGGKR